MVFDPEPPQCDTQTAHLCQTTTSFGITVSGTLTKTTTTAVGSVCATVLGCGLEDDDSTKTTSKVAECTPPPARRALPPLANRAANPDPIVTYFPDPANPAKPSPNDPKDWADDMKCASNGADHILYPKKYKNGDVSAIRRRLALSGLVFYEIRSEILDFTAYFHIENLPKPFQEKLAKMSGVRNSHRVLSYTNRC